MDRQEQTGTIGRLTYTDIAHTSDFLMPMEPDAWNIYRPPFSRQIARMGAELSADGYSLYIKPWIDAGWEDCTFIVEDKIVPLDRERDTWRDSIESAWKRRRARSLIQGSNLITDTMRAVRQIMVTDLGKALVMTRKAQDGGLMVAISFIGTTEKYFDWFSNFKFKLQSGMHAGFWDLARAFDEKTGRISLPEAARITGRETFTLADAVDQAAKPESNVRFWITGHSQGGALVQTYTYLLMQHGVPAERIHGYTYGAPTVASLDGGMEPGLYPIYNIVSTDDVVTRVGAQVRLGMDWIYRPNEAFRKKHYRVEDSMEQAVGRAMHMASKVQSTHDATCWGIALMRMMRSMDEKTQDSLLTAVAPQMLFLRRVNLSLSDVTTFLEGMLTGRLPAMAPEELSAAMIDEYAASLAALREDFGVKGMAGAIMRTMVSPHRIRPDKQDERYEPPYIAIVRRHLGMCDRGIWHKDVPARCIGSQGVVLLPSRHGRMLTSGLLQERTEPACIEDSQEESL